MILYCVDVHNSCLNNLIVIGFKLILFWSNWNFRSHLQTTCTTVLKITILQRNLSSIIESHWALLQT